MGCFEYKINNDYNKTNKKVSQNFPAANKVHLHFQSRMAVMAQHFLAKDLSVFWADLKTLLQDSLFGPEFNGDYKFRTMVGKTDFSEQFKKIVTRYTNML